MYVLVFFLTYSRSCTAVPTNSGTLLTPEQKPCLNLRSFPAPQSPASHPVYFLCPLWTWPGSDMLGPGCCHFLWYFGAHVRCPTEGYFVSLGSMVALSVSCLSTLQCGCVTPSSSCENVTVGIRVPVFAMQSTGCLFVGSLHMDLGVECRVPWVPGHAVTVTALSRVPSHTRRPAALHTLIRPPSLWVCGFVLSPGGGNETVKYIQF